MIFLLIKEIKNLDNTNKINRDILTAVFSAKNFVADNPNVIFTRADKVLAIVRYIFMLFMRVRTLRTLVFVFVK